MKRLLAAAAFALVAEPAVAQDKRLETVCGELFGARQTAIRLLKEGWPGNVIVQDALNRPEWRNASRCPFGRNDSFRESNAVERATQPERSGFQRTRGAKRTRREHTVSRFRRCFTAWIVGSGGSLSSKECGCTRARESILYRPVELVVCETGGHYEIDIIVSHNSVGGPDERIGTGWPRAWEGLSWAWRRLSREGLSWAWRRLSWEGLPWEGLSWAFPLWCLHRGSGFCAFSLSAGCHGAFLTTTDLH